ncbi:helix-turn-helix transcriptional regulator [Corynebacterium kroppenstedtii]|uniref:helix-turn-helix transcriptional regulator n=1 Tax=Corynebacterium sp. PCR 32 TaxID=3351342 RepID=UPI00309F7C36
MRGNAPGPEGQTRERIMSLLLHKGTMSASELSKELNLTTAGVRRHVDNLVTDGLAEEAPATGGPPRGRGRPARTFRLTDKGRGNFGYDYDRVAVLALEALREAGGPNAVNHFAQQRMTSILRDAEIDDTPCDPTDPDTVEMVVTKVAEALSKYGYAATVNKAGGGIQICRHHCPIQGVAEHFPEMCAAEHEAVRDVLGHHTQPLATIVDGNGVCTTHIPLGPVHDRHHDRKNGDERHPTVSAPL